MGAIGEPGATMVAVTTTLEAEGSPAPGPRPDRPGVPRWSFGAFALGGLALLVIAVIALVGSDDGTPGAASPSSWRGRLLEPAPQRPDAVLVDTDGRPFDLRGETAGEPTLLFFGYTNCPDACPIQMAQLTEALDRIGRPVQVVFVTTDPARDTPERLRSWLDNFDPSIVGLTGDPQVLADLQRNIGTTPAIAEAPDADGDYLVGHSTAVFLITGDDRAHLAYPTGTRQEDWVHDLPKALDDPAWSTPA